jgi:iron only hydrogenase large subunit-like protein
VLDSYPALPIPKSRSKTASGLSNDYSSAPQDSKIFIASISPQVRASLAATYNISERRAGYMIDQFLRGPSGLRKGGKYNNGFTWVVDTNTMRQVCLSLAADEVAQSLTPNFGPDAPIRPILTSACPGWICYAEKTHPHVLPHLSRLKSPQALTGTLLKSALSKTLNIHPSQIWHVALMPCFDKKLEASREELTDQSWYTSSSSLDPSSKHPPVRDVDCVITTRELFTLASAREITLSSLPLKPLPPTAFPDPTLSSFLFPPHPSHNPSPSAGPSGGYLHHILTHHQRLHPGSSILTTRGRNADVIDYVLLSSDKKPLLKCARYYGFRNIQNLVRKLKPPKTGPRLPGAASRGAIRRPGSGGRDALATEYAYVEVMACPGGCTNGGGQIRVEDTLQMSASGNADAIDGIETSTPAQQPGPQEQREWLAKVDEAYFSAADSDLDEDGSGSGQSADVEMADAPLSNGHAKELPSLESLLSYWSSLTAVPPEKLAYTTFRAVESDVGKNRPDGDLGTERVVELAGRVGGGW